MEIKEKLKKMDIKISKMSRDFNVSRPTLDHYLTCYQSGIPIPNETYQKLFEHLFSDEITSTIDFTIKYDYVKKALTSQEKYPSINLSELQGNKFAQKLMNYLSSRNVDNELVNFFDLFLENSDNDLVKSVYMYFNYVNGLVELPEHVLEKDKILFSNLFVSFNQYKENSLEFNLNNFKAFEEKCIRVYKRKHEEQKVDEIIRFIKEKTGSNKDIDYDSIRQKLIKEKGE